MSVRFSIGNGNGNAHSGDKGAHQQNKAELQANLERLVNEYKASHPTPINASRLVKKLQDEKARKWAIENEPNRDLPYLLESMEGVKADTKPRNVNGQTYRGTSSVVESVTQISPNLVQVTMKDGKTYTYGANSSELERFLTSPSMGKELNNARKDTPTSVRALYHTK